MEAGASEVVSGQGDDPVKRVSRLYASGAARQGRGPGVRVGNSAVRPHAALSPNHGLGMDSLPRGVGLGDDEDEATSLAPWPTLAVRMRSGRGRRISRPRRSSCRCRANRRRPANFRRRFGAGQSSPFPPPPGQTRPRQQAFPRPPGGPRARRRLAVAPPPARQSVCETFPCDSLARVEKGAPAIQAAGERKASREEVCPLFKPFVSQGSQDDHVPGHQPDRSAACRPRSIRRSRRTTPRRYASATTSAAPGPPPPAGPTLSDALGGPIIADDTSAKQPGRGTFDTLTGNVLAR